MEKPQFSKILVSLCAGFAGIIILTVPILTVILGLTEIVASAMITAAGSIGLTATVFYMKKSQAENTVKIYLGAYKEIIQLKKDNKENVSDTINEAEHYILNKMNDHIDNQLDDATTLITKEDIPVG